MDLAQILRELLKHKRWLAAGVILALVVGISTSYRPSLSPPKLEKRSIELGAATTQLAVDSPSSSLLGFGVGTDSLDPLNVRAAIFAQLMSSPPALRAIAREANIPPQALVSQSLTASEPGSEERANELVKETQSYRLSFQARDQQPLISIAAQAPSGDKAIRLANAAATGFTKYLEQQQIDEDVSKDRRVKLRQLGEATGGLVNPGVNLLSAMLAGFGAYIGFCLLLLLFAGLRRDLKSSAAAEAHVPENDADQLELNTSAQSPESDVAWLPAPPEDAVTTSRRDVVGHE